MTFYLIKIIQTLLMPPALMIIMMIAGLIIFRWSQRYGKTLIISSVVLLIAASLPVISKPLVRAMEHIPALSSKQMKTLNAQAIVVLGGGSYLNAPEYEADTVSTPTLERIRYAAYLHNKTRLPILVSGGRVYDYVKTAEATSMKAVLENELNSLVRWPEDQARNTWENAQYSQKMLSQENITKIILVTHALHMPRSVMCFEAAGFEVTPAPLAFHSTSSNISITHFIPSSGAMSNLSNLMHEIIGTLWYRLRYM